MYSNYKSIQILLALLKKYNVRNIITSPGGSNTPIVHSIENDAYFKTYSVVDERSAVYFGIGIAQIINEPVACLCTSGTAVSNYLPGMTEAYYQNVPIIAITADKNPYFTGQLEIQKTEQRNIFGDVSKKSVDLPLCNTDDEEWYCARLIKEALLASSHHGKGPVHINIPLVGSYANYNVKELPEISPITVINCENSEEVWKGCINVLKESKKILIIVGQNILFSEEDKNNIETFFAKFNCVISVEHLSNLECEGTVFTYPVTETGNTKEPDLVPDLVISMGNNLANYGMKPFLRRNCKQIQHFAIDEGGRVRDVYQSLTTIFECTPSYFFRFFAKNDSGSSNNQQYYNAWKNESESIVLPEFDFSNFYLAKQLSCIIPENSILHLAILNSARVMQFFELAKGVRVHSNVGALGIDGCLSTFMGHAAVTEELAFLVIGDLSFFYDMNAAGIKHLDKNVRIILLNNGGGAEFQFFLNKKDIPTLNENICAEHRKIAKGWISSLGYEYQSVTTKEQLNDVFDSFAEKSDRPKFLEVFTKMEEDAFITREFYNINQQNRSVMQKAKGVAFRLKNKISK
ncbi:2-succinyl-5-enolpyruvyl-6-hydroxy-3-cyclohexene-1-carboxylic-acid synthase [Labilibaculum manganireducens]|uniref:2-succinyl-5-enolpyruvyl-6-hydroxy-3- cyclohexene-1-carboxylic-acid synthase n=1 Tax=Labilibaculum manganireducens TaxID=1940525 RepID=UPI0029F551E5|nr:2-succinyl-5-enolpyruvyl-6-hydroxy-3-cyclohexene-1-carboxylic-acid synthase [Labilibaculum manganireducens]